VRPVALITGGARGIGRAIATDLAADHDIALTWASTPPDAVLADLPQALALRADFTDPAAAPAVVAQTVARYGRIDVLVNNAGAITENDHAEPDLERLRALFEVNVLAPMALFAAALPHFGPGASVISISSVNARLPALGAPAYSASKAALETWTRAAAKAHGAQGLRINAVAPGAIEHPDAPRPPDLLQQFLDVTALGRAGSADDIAAAVRFLASDGARFITGEVLTVSGGYRL